MDEERKGMDNFHTSGIKAAMKTTKKESHHQEGDGFPFLPLNKKPHLISSITSEQYKSATQQKLHSFPDAGPIEIKSLFYHLSLQQERN